MEGVDEAVADPGGVGAGGVEVDFDVVDGGGALGDELPVQGDGVGVALAGGGAGFADFAEDVVDFDGANLDRFVGEGDDGVAGALGVGPWKRLRLVWIDIVEMGRWSG